MWNLRDEDELHLFLQSWQESEYEVRIQRGGQAKQLQVQEQTNIIRSVCSPGNNQPHDSLGSCWNKPPWNCGSIFHLPVAWAKTLKRVSSLISPLRLCLSWPGPPPTSVMQDAPSTRQIFRCHQVGSGKKIYFFGKLGSVLRKKKQKIKNHSACQEVKNSLYHKQKQIFLVICKEMAAFGGTIHYSVLNKQSFLHKLYLPAP